MDCQLTPVTFTCQTNDATTTDNAFYYLFRLLSAVPNDRLCVLPTSEDKFVHGVDLCGRGGQTNVAVVRPAVFELQDA